jgi:hypothetical protein
MCAPHSTSIGSEWRIVGKFEDIPLANGSEYGLTFNIERSDVQRPWFPAT